MAPVCPSRLVLVAVLFISCSVASVSAQENYVDIYDYLAQGDENQFVLDCGDQRSASIHVRYYGEAHMIYAPAYKKTCQLTQTRPTVFEIHISKDNAEQCGTKRAGSSETYYIDLLVQGGRLRQSTDTVHTITCNYEKGMVEMVHHLTDEGAIQRVPEMGGVGGSLSIIIELYIRDRRDHIIQHTLLGDPIHLDAQVGNVSTGIRAWNCWATDGTNDTSVIYRILQSGCGDGIILPRTDGFVTRGEVTWSPNFAAFALPGATLLQIICDFVVCENTINCDGPSCTEFEAASDLEQLDEHRRQPRDHARLVRASTTLAPSRQRRMNTPSGNEPKSHDNNLKSTRSTRSVNEHDICVPNGSNSGIPVASASHVAADISDYDLAKGPEDGVSHSEEEEEEEEEEAEEPVLGIDDLEGGKGEIDKNNETSVVSSQVVQILDFIPEQTPPAGSTLHPIAALGDEDDVIITTETHEETTMAMAVPGDVDIGKSSMDEGVLLPVVAAVAGMGLLILLLSGTAIFLWHRNRQKSSALQRLMPWRHADTAPKSGSPAGHTRLLGSPAGSLLQPILRPVSDAGLPDNCTSPSTSWSAVNGYPRQERESPMSIDVGGDLVLNNIRAVVDDRGQIYSVDEIRRSLLPGEQAALEEIPQRVEHMDHEDELTMFSHGPPPPSRAVTQAHMLQPDGRAERHVRFPDVAVDQAPLRRAYDVNMPRPRPKDSSNVTSVITDAAVGHYQEAEAARSMMYRLADPWALVAPNEDRGSSRSVNEGDLDDWVSSESLNHRMPVEETDSESVHTARIDHSSPPAVVPYGDSPQTSGAYEPSIQPRVVTAGMSMEWASRQRSSPLSDLWYQYIMNPQPAASNTSEPGIVTHL